MKLFYIVIVVVAWLYVFVKIHRTVHYKQTI